MPNITTRKKHLLPGILSLFIPGVGQLIKGHGYKAVGIWVVWVVIGFLFGWWFWLPGAIVQIGAAIDAYVSNKKEDLF